jgi:hypothetical protein
MNNQRLLNILWSALLIRYAAIYLPLAAVASFSQNWTSLLPFTLCFWIVCSILVLAEKQGSYTEINDTDLVQSYFFHETHIPIANILGLKSGHSPGIIGHPKSVDMEFERNDGRHGVRHILRHQFAANDINNFSRQLAKRSDKIAIDITTPFVT